MPQNMMCSNVQHTILLYANPLKQPWGQIWPQNHLVWVFRGPITKVNQFLITTPCKKHGRGPNDPLPITGKKESLLTWSSSDSMSHVSLYIGPLHFRSESDIFIPLQKHGRAHNDELPMTEKNNLDWPEAAQTACRTFNVLFPHMHQGMLIWFHSPMEIPSESLEWPRMSAILYM